MALRKKCQAILDVSGNVRYAGAVNAYGRTLAGILRPGLKPMLKPEDAKNEFFILATMLSLRGTTSAGIGRMSHGVLLHKKATIVAIRKGEITFYVSVAPAEGDIDGTIQKIKGLI